MNGLSFCSLEYWLVEWSPDAVVDVEQLIFDLFHRGIHFGAHTVDGHAFTGRKQIDRLCLRRRNTTCAEKIIEQQQMVRRVIRRELCYVLPDDVEYLLNVDFRLLVGLVSGAGNCRPAAVCQLLFSP